MACQFALDTIETATGEKKRSMASAICVGGTLLSAALALDGAGGRTSVSNPRRSSRPRSDFTHAGDLKIFVDEEQIQSLGTGDEGARGLPRMATRWRRRSTCCVRAT